MPRLLALALFAIATTAGPALAQVSYGNSAIPGRRALSRLDLDIQWNGVVPLAGAEKVTELSIDQGMLFAQTSLANFYAYDAESGRYLWNAHLGRAATNAEPASVNGFAVYVTNSNKLIALDRKTGREIWKVELTHVPSSATIADNERVMVGTEEGKMETFDARTGAIKWNMAANARIDSRPLLAGKLVAFASEDSKVYVSRIDMAKLIWRFAAGGPIVAPLSSHGTRTLLIPSTDKTLYAVDLYSGESIWSFATGAPLRSEPIVVDNDIYVVNSEGILSEIDAETGQSRWTISTLGGRLIAVSEHKLYLESHDDDLFIVDRVSGKIIHNPAATFQRAGVNLREYALGPTNRFDDRLYFGTTHGLIICLRELKQIRPRLIHPADAKPFGYIPAEGLPLSRVPAAAPTTDPTAPPADAEPPKP